MIKRYFYTLILMSLIVACSDDEGASNMTNELSKISISNVTLFEGDENFNFDFKISINTISELEISVDYNTEEITAGIGSDFMASSGTVNIPPGETEAIISIEIISDINKETDEQFAIVLSNPINATIISTQGIGTIRNDDTFVDIPEDGYITPETYVGYDLVWSDEFEGEDIDEACWTHELGAHGWGNNELQNYTASRANSYLTDGKLVIEAIEDGSNYTSARMITRDKKEFSFGRIDIRAILPEGQGVWPALWMLGHDFGEIGWPACGEIDIMELIGHEPSTSHGTAHWGPQGQDFSNYKGESYNLSGEKFSEKFHVFSIIWEAGEIKWLVDDNLFFTLSQSDVNGIYPFNKDFFFIFNVAIGGNWPGNPDSSTTFPQRMYVDYIRVFQ